MAYQIPATINRGNARTKRDFARPNQIRPASTAYTVTFANVPTANAPHELKSGAPGSSTGTPSKGVGPNMRCTPSNTVHNTPRVPAHHSHAPHAPQHTTLTPRPPSAT